MSEADNSPQSQADLVRKSNAEYLAQWAIDVNQDPWSVPLERLDPGHPSLFEANKMLPYFERLRAEAPVNYCEESQFGPYWSVTKFDDIKYVDGHEKLFSSDSRHGGIRLGGQAQ
ncbi:MAG: hypothetical protein E4H01_12495, partial [Lysobacterales bacterium]